MKKLNRKGFTLIELLAVIVILAIIVVVTVPTIINTISDARVSSIWNLAGSVANSYDTMAAQDLLATNKVLDGIQATTTWQCIGDIKNNDGSKTLAGVLGLSSNDLNLATTGVNTTDVKTSTCSAIRLNSTSGGAEVFLLANSSGGKFNISGKKVYALSTEDEGKQEDITSE